MGYQSFKISCAGHIYAGLDGSKSDGEISRGRGTRVKYFQYVIKSSQLSLVRGTKPAVGRKSIINSYSVELSMSLRTKKGGVEDLTSG